MAFAQSSRNVDGEVNIRADAHVAQERDA